LIPWVVDWHRSIDELLGRDTGRWSGPVRGLPDRHRRAMMTPIDQLEADDVAMLIRQSPSAEELALLIPIAIRLVDRDLCAAYGTPLIVYVAELSRERPEVRRTLIEVIARRADMLADLEPTDEVTRTALAIVKRDRAALVRIELAYAFAGRWAEVERLQASRGATHEDRVAFHIELARITEQRDGPTAAVARWRAVVDVDRGYLPAWSELERLCIVTASWRELVSDLDDLATVHLERGDLAAASEALVRAADIAITRLDDADLAETLEQRLGIIARHLR
jgi:hypothetical protein